MPTSTVVEIPPNATDQVVRIQRDEFQKAIRQARAAKKDRVRCLSPRPFVDTSWTRVDASPGNSCKLLQSESSREADAPEHRA